MTTEGPKGGRIVPAAIQNAHNLINHHSGCTSLHRLSSTCIVKESEGYFVSISIRRRDKNCAYTQVLDKKRFMPDSALVSQVSYMANIAILGIL